MAHTWTGAYDEFTTFQEAKKFYKRCRTLKCFLLEEKTVEKIDPICAHCGKKFSEHSKVARYDPADEKGEALFEYSKSQRLANHCWYNPKTKKIIIMQYICSWQNTLNNVFSNANRLY